MNCLDVKVSIFKKYNSPDGPQDVNLSTFLKSEKYKKEVEAIRATDDKDERDKLKAKLPAITPSGTFSRREQAALIKHSCLIQFDIDGHHNKHITNFSDLKKQIPNLKEVAYCGLSVSGRGFWGLVPIAHPDKHKLHFNALKQDFEKWGIVLDNLPKNVASLRGYSYDPEAYFNPQAKVYTKLFKPKPQEYRKSYPTNNSTPEAKKVELCLQAIEAGRIDITGSYSEWFSIGCALANEFGEAGRDYFHRTSQYYPNYDFSKTDKQFSHVLRRNYSTTIATFYHLADRQGITYKEALQSEREEAQEPEQEPSPYVDGLPTGWKYQTFDNGHKVLLDADGLPATWNLCPNNELEKETIEKEEKRTGIQANPVVGQLIERFGFEIESIESY